MTFSIFLPPQAEEGGKLPVVWYLSGLTCTHANVTDKGEYRAACAELGLVLVAPDTSPRGPGVPTAPEGAWDFGLGAGFYVDATQDPWAKHYRMWSYVTDELPALVVGEFPVDAYRQGITGHSMGGHGALTVALRNPDIFRSVSAFAPMVAPGQVAWGQKALTGYLGSDRAAWRGHDAVALIEDGARMPELLIVAGVRTFALIGLVSGLAGLLGRLGQTFAAGALVAGAVAVTAIGYARRPDLSQKPDATTPVAAVATTGLGFFAGFGEPGLAIAG